MFCKVLKGMDATFIANEKENGVEDRKVIELTNTIYSDERKKLEKFYMFNNLFQNKFIIIEEEPTFINEKLYTIRVTIIKNFSLKQEDFTDEEIQAYEEMQNLLNTEKLLKESDATDTTENLVESKA